MREGLRNFIIGTCAKLDIGVMRLSRQKELEECGEANRDLGLLMELPESHTVRLLKLMRNSKSLQRQDLFVLSTMDFKTGGYFVEFGATNGIDLNNTFMLEKEFGWTGILAEPARRWHDALRKNRGCQIETDCVWSASNANLTFHEADSGEYSTIDAYSRTGRNPNKSGHNYNVRTISLEDMLDKYNAPRQIDYISVDTEGSEFEILSAFNFGKYEFRVLTVEHNFQPDRAKICELLTRNGYARKLEELSGIDDWYVKV
jgi:FkbM family methyltransferase